MDARYRSLLPGGLLAAALIFLMFQPSPEVLRPLPWDMSHHYLGACDFADAVASGHPVAVRRQFLAADQYPPGHSVLLGSWLLAAGRGLRSWLLFQFVSLVAAVVAVWCCGFALDGRDRRPFFTVGLVALLASPLVLTMAGSFLVELPAASLAVLAVASLAAIGDGSRRRLTMGAVVAGALVSATLLTKYNVGLPLIPAALVLAAYPFARRRRGAALAVAAAAVTGALVWVAYLSLQDHGWQSFLSFAQNRANAEQLNPLQRLGVYADIYLRAYAAHPAVGVVLALLAVTALMRRRGALTVVAAVYSAATIVALVGHPYILTRNLFSFAVMIVVLAATGAAVVAHDIARFAPRSMRVIRLGGLAVAAILFVVGAGQARTDLEAYYKGNDESLRRASEFLAQELARPGSCRVVGTFNELSAGWVRVLSRQADTPSSMLATEFPYPLAKDRDQLDPRFDPVYADRVADWRQHPEDRVITITVDEGSRYWSDDYEHFSSWKRNYVDALAGRADLVPGRSLDLAEAGLHLRVLETSDEPLRFGAGWGPAESWGRWSLAERATVTVRFAATRRLLHLRFAAFAGLDTPKRCRVLRAGRVLDDFEISGAPWVWQDRFVPLPPESGPGTFDLQIECSRLDASGGRLRAVPFAVVALEAAH